MMRLFLPIRKNSTNSAWNETSEIRQNRWDFSLFRSKANFLLFRRKKNAPKAGSLWGVSAKCGPDGSPIIRSTPGCQFLNLWCFSCTPSSPFPGPPQYIRCRNSQVAVASVTTAITDMGQMSCQKYSSPAPSRKTRRTMVKKYRMGSR